MNDLHLLMRAIGAVEAVISHIMNQGDAKICLGDFLASAIERKSKLEALVNDGVVSGKWTVTEVLNQAGHLKFKV